VARNCVHCFIVASTYDVMAETEGTGGGEATDTTGSGVADGKMRGVNSSNCGFTVFRRRRVFDCLVNSCT